jgi:hypothetical protein
MQDMQNYLQPNVVEGFHDTAASSNVATTACRKSAYANCIHWVKTADFRHSQCGPVSLKTTKVNLNPRDIQTRKIFEGYAKR